MTGLRLNELEVKKGVAALYKMHLPAFPKNHQENCSERFQGFYCTRVRGHEGLHVAHTSSDGLAVALWGEERSDEWLQSVVILGRLLS